MSKKKSSVRSDLLKTSVQHDLESQNSERCDTHPDVLAISGIVPDEVDAVAGYRDHLLKKQR